MRITICIIICLSQIFSYACATNGKYTVIAPGTIHSNDIYTVAVSVHQTRQPCNIKVGITGPTYHLAQQVTVFENKVKNVEFNLPNLPFGDYNLTAEGVNCFNNFKNTTKLIYEKFIGHVKVLTDKGLYKPGDDINYRILFMDKDLKPTKPQQDAFIWLEDGTSKNIETIKDFITTNGVYKGKFRIHEHAATGHWSLNVQNGDNYRRMAYFDVEQYALPKYVATVENTPKVSVKDGDMQVIVRASYTYGKPLRGKATVVLSLKTRYYPTTEQHMEAPTLTKTADMVKGKAKFDFNVKVYEDYMSKTYKDSYISILATVEDQITGVKLNVSEVTRLYSDRYIVTCYENCSSFEAGKVKDVLYRITSVDGTLLSDTRSNVELIYKEVLLKEQGYIVGSSYNDDKQVTPTSKNLTLSFSGHLNKTGFVSFKVSLPDLPEYYGYFHFYMTELKYLDEQHKSYNMLQHREPKKSNEYFILTEDAKLNLNKPSQFTVDSSQPLSYFDYIVVGRGNILKSGHVDLPNKAKSYRLVLIPENSWAPTFAIYVYYVDEKDVYHYAERRFNIDFELQNQIDITVARQLKPRNKIPFKVRTPPNSYVGVMVVDQNTLLLQNNNDLWLEDLGFEVGAYSTRTPNQGGYSVYPGTTSGCVTLTNADYLYNWTKPKYPSMSPEDLQAFKSRELTSRTGMGLFMKPVLDDSLESNLGLSKPASDFDIQIYKDSSKTWLFDDFLSTDAAEFTWYKTIPENLTSWILTGFSLHPSKGLGITKDLTKITAFQPLVIFTQLPYSIKRSEVIKVPVMVFNNFEKTLDVEVTLHNIDEEYEIIGFDGKIIYESNVSKRLRVPAYGSAEISFLLTPSIFGNIMLKFIALSSVGSYSSQSLLKVLPEGIPHYVSRAYFVDLTKVSEVKSSFELQLPSTLVPDSKQVEVIVMGDILGPTLNYLDNLVRLAVNSGEQIISNMMSKYQVSSYLQRSRRLFVLIGDKLRHNQNTNYQKILKYRHNDNSFSNFGPDQAGENLRTGSTWLTAYVMRALLQINVLVDVSDEIIKGGFNYLSKQQAENGTFTENGEYFHPSQRNHVSLTSAAVLALLENSNYAHKYSNALSKGLEFIARNIDTFDSLHAQAIGTYTLNKAKHAAAKEKLAKLKTLAKATSDRMWWSSHKQQLDGSNDVEITSYALLTLLDQETTKVDDVLPIIKWLLEQRNSHGGFASPTDTVVALTALFKFAQFAHYAPAKMDIDIKSKDKEESIKLTGDNSILYQTVKMPENTESIEFNAKGSGSAVVQVSYQYNNFVRDPRPSFTIETTRTDNKLYRGYLELLVCVDYVGEGLYSNMAVLEITAPSGYVFNKAKLNKIKELKRVRITEVKNLDSLLVVYFDRLDKYQKTCFNVEALRSYYVANQRPTPIRLYDYYDTNKYASYYYVLESKLCDICETEEECRKCK